MKEQKVCSFTRNGYRLQLLKITDNNAAQYYEIRENRRITGTYSTIEAAHKRFMNLTYLDTMQKRLSFDEVEPIRAPGPEGPNLLTTKQAAALYEYIKHYKIDIFTDKKTNYKAITYNEAIDMYNKIYNMQK